MKVKVCGIITMYVNKCIEVQENESPFELATKAFSGLRQNDDGSINVTDTHTESLELIENADVDFFDYDIIE